MIYFFNGSHSPHYPCTYWTFIVLVHEKIIAFFYAVLGVLLPGIILITLFRIPFLNLIPLITAILFLIFLPKIKKIGKQIIGDLFSYFDIGSSAIE